MRTITNPEVTPIGRRGKKIVYRIKGVKGCYRLAKSSRKIRPVAYMPKKGSTSQKKGTFYITKVKCPIWQKF